MSCMFPSVCGTRAALFQECWEKILILFLCDTNIMLMAELLSGNKNVCASPLLNCLVKLRILFIKTWAACRTNPGRLPTVGDVGSSRRLGTQNLESLYLFQFES